MRWSRIRSLEEFLGCLFVDAIVDAENLPSATLWVLLSDDEWLQIVVVEVRKTIKCKIKASGMNST